MENNHRLRKQVCLLVFDGRRWRTTTTVEKESFSTVHRPRKQACLLIFDGGGRWWWWKQEGIVQPLPVRVEYARNEVGRVPPLPTR